MKVFLHLFWALASRNYQVAQMFRFFPWGLFKAEMVLGVARIAELVISKLNLSADAMRTGEDFQYREVDPATVSLFASVKS